MVARRRRLRARGARGSPTIRRVFRSGAHATVAVVALAAAIYATASLTGEWLGEPPWWTRSMDIPGGTLTPISPPGPPRTITIAVEIPREGRETISGAIAVVGYALFAVAAWPRKEPLEPDENGS
jgi:hypothetical protein